MAQPTITVAMSVYNGEKHLAEAIESIIGQSFGDFEFLILNDGSTDQSRAIIDRYAIQDARIRPIHRENRGLIESLNQLLREARAPLIARMDDDDVAMPERFARQLAFLEAHPDHAVVGAWNYDIDENGTVHPLCPTDQPVDNDAIVSAFAAGRAVICHPVVMMRADVVRAVGGYHKAFKHCEDYDLWLRMSSVTKLANLPERLIKYRRSDSQVSHHHTLEQQTGAAVAHVAYRTRLAGLPDPTASLPTLPPIAGLDTLFHSPGVSDEVRARVVRGILYSVTALRGEGLDLIIEHLRHRGSKDGLWMTVLRLVRIGEIKRAARLTAALIRS